jgi:hypothetical protein
MKSTAEDELALLLAGTGARRARWAARIEELSTRVDEDRLIATLVRQRILLVVGMRLLGAAGVDVTPAFRAQLAAVHAAARVRAMAIATTAGHLTGALEGAGIPAIGLKGGGLSAELYGDAALRTYDDVDLLVPVGDLDRAVAVARALGWTEAGARAGIGSLPSLHRALWHPSAGLTVEIHWRIHWHESGFSAGLFEHSRIVGAERRLDPHDELAALLLFYARDGFAGLRLAADIGAWWDRHGSNAALDSLRRRLAEHRQLAETWRAALAVSAEVAGLPCDDIRPLIRSRSRRAAVARRLVNWDLRGDPDQIMANVTLADALLAPARGLPAFVRRRTAAAASTLALSKTLTRYAIALWGLRRGRCWSPILQPDGRLSHRMRRW